MLRRTGATVHEIAEVLLAETVSTAARLRGRSGVCQDPLEYAGDQTTLESDINAIAGAPPAALPLDVLDNGMRAGPVVEQIRGPP